MSKKTETPEQPVEQKKGRKTAGTAGADAAKAAKAPQAGASGQEALEPLDAEHPDMTPEEVEALVKGTHRTHAEGLGDAWAVVLGRNPAALMPQVVGTVLHDGGTRPSWQWKRSGKEYVLMAWPKDQALRAAVLMRAEEEGGQMKPFSATPLREGLPNDLTVEDVQPWENGGGADVAVSMMEGRNPMWFYDPLYLRDKDDLTPGITHTFSLAGLCFALRKALLDDVTITHGPQFEVYAERWLADNPGKSRLDVPPLKVSMKGRRMIMPGRRFCEYQLRAEVERVQQGELEKMPITILYLRFPFDNRPPMLLPVFASRMVLGNYEPQVGDEVDAYVWLQGRVIDFDPQAPDAVDEETPAAPVQ